MGIPGAHRCLPLGRPSKASPQLLRQLLPHRALSICQSAQSFYKIMNPDSVCSQKHGNKEELSVTAAPWP